MTPIDKMPDLFRNRPWSDGWKLTELFSPYRTSRVIQSLRFLDRFRMQN